MSTEKIPLIGPTSKALEDYAAQLYTLFAYDVTARIRNYPESQTSMRGSGYVIHGLRVRKSYPLEQWHIVYTAEEAPEVKIPLWTVVGRFDAPRMPNLRPTRKPRTQPADPSMFTPQIRRGVPIPAVSSSATPSSAKRVNYSFDRLELGECVFIPLYIVDRTTVQTAAARYNQQHAGRDNKRVVTRFTTMDGEEGIGIWRTD